MLMNNNYRLMFGLGATSLIAGIGMFTYQNFFHEQSQLKHLTTVYVAKDDIPAYTQIKENMLTPISIPKVGLIQGSVENIEEAITQYTSHGLKKGELLMEQQLEEEAINDEGDLQIPIEGTYKADIKAGNTVGVYVLIQKDGKTNDVLRVFTAKKVYQTAITQDGEEPLTYIKVSEKELQTYFEALKTGEIIIAKHLTETPTIIDEFNTDELIDFSSTETSNSEEESSNETDINNTDNTEKNENSSSGLYSAKENDTWESIASKFKIDLDELYKLNENIVNIEKGTILVVPAI